ncbi:MAG: hypothetical protein AAFU66_11180 [Pseudomonadota bacterium]
MSDKAYCHEHNLVDSSNINDERPWGIRVTAPPSDPFNKLVGADWEKFHWFQTRDERDQKLEQMRRRHGFYRIGDDPSIVLESVDRNT